jgi:hypothetical protein
MDNQTQETKSPTGKAKTTPALLDLDAALEEFRSTVNPLLKMGEEKDWDGPRLLAQEQTILRSALVLAGQCIALLLTRLVSSPRVQQTARQHTQPLRQPTSAGHGSRRVNVTVIGGVSVPLLVKYVVARKPRKSRGRKRKRGRRGAAQQQGFYPVLSLLGIADRLSPLIRSLVAEHGNLSISFAAACHTLNQIGIAMSTKRVARVTHAFNQIGLRQRHHQVERYRQGILPTGTLLKGQQVVLSVDGGRTRIRRPKRGRRRKGSRHHGYHANWREPKLLTIYIVDKRGRKVKKGRIPVTNDGTFEGVEAFMDLLGMHLTRLGIRHARWVHLIGDGAPWIWERVPTLLRQLGCPADIISEAVDFCHAAGKLNDFAQLAFSSQSEARAWFKKERRFLKQGQVGKVLRHVETSLTQAKASSRGEMQTIYEYFVKHQHRMAYGKLALDGLPIGSGAVESLIRQVVNLRLKSAGKFWLEPHAEGVLLARCWWAASQWEQFRDFVLTAGLVPLPSN